MHPSDDECPNCGAGGYNVYCWDCGYDSELEEAIANAEPLLIDQVDPDEDEIYE